MNLNEFKNQLSTLKTPTIPPIEDLHKEEAATTPLSSNDLWRLNKRGYNNVIEPSHKTYSINDFKSEVKKIQEIKRESYTVNIASTNFNKIYSDSHCPQSTVHKIIPTVYRDPSIFFRSGAVCNEGKKLFPKMLNWQNAKTDFYVWIDEEYEIVDKHAIEWMITNIVDSRYIACFFKHPTRNNILEEVEYIQQEIDNKNPEILGKYDIDEVRKHAQFCIDKYKVLKEFPLLDTSVFLYARPLVENYNERNFMLEWLGNTVSWSMNDRISLLYTILSIRDFNFSVFDEPDLTLDNNPFIRKRTKL